MGRVERVDTRVPGALNGSTRACEQRLELSTSIINCFLSAFFLSFFLFDFCFFAFSVRRLHHANASSASALTIVLVIYSDLVLILVLVLVLVLAVALYPEVLKSNAERLIAIGRKAVRKDNMPRALRVATLILLLRGDMGWRGEDEAPEPGSDEAAREGAFLDMIRMTNASAVWLANVAEEAEALKGLFAGTSELRNTRGNMAALTSHLSHLHRRLDDFMWGQTNRRLSRRPLFFFFFFFTPNVNCVHNFNIRFIHKLVHVQVRVVREWFMILEAIARGNTRRRERWHRHVDL